MPLKDPAAYRAYQRAYQAAHREKIAAQKAARYQARREEILAEERAYRQAHPDEQRAKDRQYYAAHREAIRAKRKPYEEAHREEAKARAAQWYAEHREEVNQRRRMQYATDPEARAKQLADVKAWRAAHPEQDAANQRAAYRAKRDERIAYATAYYCEHRVKAIDATKRSMRRHPKEVRARRKLWVAIWRGQIVKPTQCEHCHRTLPSRRIHGHHVNYDHPLDVIWLCSRCHAEVHAKET